VAEDLLAQDIAEQPEALAATAAGLGADRRQALRRLAADAERWVFSGMGASFFACYPAVLRLWAAGRPAVWVETAELLHFAEGLLGPGTALVLVSQSGETAEIVHLLPRLPREVAVVAVTNHPESTLGRAAHLLWPLGAGAERAVCSTKTYTATLLALDVLADALLGRDGDAARGQAVQALRQALAASEGWLEALAQAFGVPEHLWLLGRGPAVSAAATGALIIKEASRVHAEGMSAPQFRHGPLEGAGPGRAALVLATPGPLGDLDLALAREMAEAGMAVAAVLLEPRPSPPGVLPVHLPACPAHLAPLVQVLPAQLLARRFALARGLTPGSFARIAKVTVRE
jgi:glucosamine--fructose-6-phosphate aminotransferase (isomerizing)